MYQILLHFPLRYGLDHYSFRCSLLRPSTMAQWSWRFLWSCWINLIPVGRWERKGWRWKIDGGARVFRWWIHERIQTEETRRDAKVIQSRLYSNDQVTNCCWHCLFALWKKPLMIKTNRIALPNHVTSVLLIPLLSLHLVDVSNNHVEKRLTDALPFSLLCLQAAPTFDSVQILHTAEDFLEATEQAHPMTTVVVHVYEEVWTFCIFLKLWVCIMYMVLRTLFTVWYSRL